MTAADIRHIMLHRDDKTPAGICGRLYATGDDGNFTWPVGRGRDRYRVQTLATGERFDEGNAPYISCIPMGDYKLVKRRRGRYHRVYSKRWGHDFVVEVADVPGRSHILLHTGNKAVRPRTPTGKVAGDSRGCILIGMSYNSRDGFISRSRVGYCAFYDAISQVPDDRWPLDLHVVDSYGPATAC